MEDLNLKDIKISRIIKFNINEITKCAAKIEMYSIADKFKVLNAFSQLRNKKRLHNIFIKRELTKEAQLHEKNLRQQRNELKSKLEFSEGNLKFGKKTLADGSEVKFYHAIRNGKLTEIHINEESK